MHFSGKHKTLTVTLAALAMIGPLGIDTYLPSFHALAQSFAVDQILIQQTLSAYLFTFALMMLFYGTLSDSFGRRPVILVSLVVYVTASLGAAAAPGFGWFLFFRALQGLAAGAGTVVSRAIVRDRFSGPKAQRMLSYMLMVFSVAPAIAPILHLPETAFGWLFIPLIGGTMIGAAVAACCAGRFRTHTLVRVGYALMALAAVVNVTYNAAFEAALPGAVLPLVLYTFGRAIATPGITVIGLDFFPENRGLASSLQSFVQMLMFALVAGFLAPLLYDSALKLSYGTLCGVTASWLCWAFCRQKYPGRTSELE